MKLQEIYFFPREIEFWVYHWVCLSLLIGSRVVIGYSVKEVVSLFNFMGMIAWLPLFTVATLTFRYFYKSKNWSVLDVRALVFLSFAFSLIFSFAITLLMFVSLTPLFISNFLLIEQFYVSNVPVSNFAYQILVVNTLQSYIFMCAWIFIYVSITSSRSVKASFYQNLKLENSLKSAKIKSLSNQINPHFLFNTLNNVRFMMYENMERADDMITSFSEILRYSLRESEKEKVCLSEEWEVAQRYMEIIELQYDKKISLNIKMDVKLENILVPPMTLQFLIENCVKHGHIFPDGGYLDIDMYHADGKFWIVVENAIQFKTNKSPIRKKIGTETGIKNLEDRLKWLYSESAELIVEKSEYKFTVKVCLPQEEVER